MQCTSFIPVFYQPRSVNGAANGFPWHLLNSNPNYGDQRGFNSSLPPSNVYHYSSYDKEVMRQMIQNHEATFRNQVQELHRLYKRQRELMDEMRMREIIAQQHLLSQTSESVQCLSQPRSDISQTSHTPNWLLGDHPHCKLPDLTVENVSQSPSFVKDSIPEQRKNSCNEVDFLSLRSKENGKQILDLELPAEVYCADQEKGNLSNAPKKIFDVKPTSGSNFGSAKTEDVSNFNFSGQRMNCLIDLNEPVQLESMSSNATGACGTHNSPMEIALTDCPSDSEEAKPESMISDHSRLLKCDDSSNGRNLSMAIDLNSTPTNCFSETETTLENLPSFTVVPDCKDKGVGDAVVNDKILETEAHFDLNTGVVSEHLRTINSVRDVENEECSVRGKSEDIQLQMPILSEKMEEKLPLEGDVVAAQTLLVISSSEIQERHESTEATKPQLLGNSGNPLYWLADIVSSREGDLENDIMKLEGDALLNKSCDFGTTVKASEKNDARKQKETGSFCTGSKELNLSEEFLETGQQRRNAGRKACAKQRKSSKIVPSDMIKKSTGSISKQPATRSRQGVLQSWGKIRKREGGHRRRTSKLLAIN